MASLTYAERYRLLAAGCTTIAGRVYSWCRHGILAGHYCQYCRECEGGK